MTPEVKELHEKKMYCLRAMGMAIETFKDDDFAYLVIRKLFAERIDELDKKLEDAERREAANQANCQHIEGGNSTLLYQFHDGHYNYYRCSLCGKEEKI